MKHLFFTAALFFSLAFISCGSSSGLDEIEEVFSDNLSKEEQYFVGTWKTDMSKARYWVLLANGSFYINDDRVPNPQKDSPTGTWTYNAQTMVFATSHGLTLSVLASSDQYFTCQNIKSTKHSIYTFNRYE